VAFIDGLEHESIITWSPCCSKLILSAENDAEVHISYYIHLNPLNLKFFFFYSFVSLKLAVVAAAEKKFSNHYFVHELSTFLYLSISQANNKSETNFCFPSICFLERENLIDTFIHHYSTGRLGWTGLYCNGPLAHSNCWRPRRHDYFKKERKKA